MSESEENFMLNKVKKVGDACVSASLPAGSGRAFNESTGWNFPIAAILAPSWISLISEEKWKEKSHINKNQKKAKG